MTGIEFRARIWLARVFVNAVEFLCRIGRGVAPERDTRTW